MTKVKALQQAKDLIDPALPLTEEKARSVAKSLLELGVEAIAFVLLQLMKRIQELERGTSLPSPSTPSGMIPPYQKPSVKGRRKKPGRHPGHPGVRRNPPTRIDRREEHRLECCPDCGSPLQRCNGKRSARTRIIEDIPETIEPEISEHVIHRDYCPRCQKSVEPPVPDALPQATIGHRLLVLSAYWHYALGMTLSQILEVLNYHLHFVLTSGGLLQMWRRLAEILLSWYEQIAEEAKKSAVLHADETGWRVDGTTYWLWCFTSADTTFYMVNRTRGSPALQQFFQEAFAGTLVTDFWSAYDAVVCEGRQYCLAHLLRELEKVDLRNASEEWQAFSKKTKRLFRDALRLRVREDFTPERYASRIHRLYERLLDLALAEYTDPDARRLAKRLEKYWDELLTFLEHPEVPSNNNHVERELRPAVQMRKMIYGNRSEKGAMTQAVLMSVFRTLKRRGYNPIDILVSTLREYVQTGKLPPFPHPITSNG